MVKSKGQKGQVFIFYHAEIHIVKGSGKPYKVISHGNINKWGKGTLSKKEKKNSEAHIHISLERGD